MWTLSGKTQLTNCIANSLLARYVAGPACDVWGPRTVFAATLLIGAIPLGLAPLVKTITGLYVSRFFIGILGGSFVPCQVWCTGFFDKNVVGTANALAGGWGNAGGGVTYFIMPAVFDSFVAMGYGDDQAWRITFIVPLIVVLFTGAALWLLCPDTPTGKWSERHLAAQENLKAHGVDAGILPSQGVVDVPGNLADKDSNKEPAASDETASAEKKEPVQTLPAHFDHEAAIPKEDMLETAKGEVIQKPSLARTFKILASPQTIFHISTYFCSFGAELAVNAILSSYYLKNFPTMGQTIASDWAAMFGFLNFVTRPLGGAISDFVYKKLGRNLWAKKIWINTCGVITGAVLIILGQLDPHDLATMNGLIALMAIFLEGGNGANFSLVPHVHPDANGIVSGTTGAAGNLGGIIFSIIFRFVGNGSDYSGALWIIGIIHIVMNLVLCWLPPIPKGQIGGH